MLLLLSLLLLLLCLRDSLRVLNDGQEVQRQSLGIAPSLENLFFARNNKEIIVLLYNFLFYLLSIFLLFSLFFMRKG